MERVQSKLFIYLFFQFFFQCSPRLKIFQSFQFVRALFIKMPASMCNKQKELKKEQEKIKYKQSKYKYSLISNILSGGPFFL